MPEIPQTFAGLKEQERKTRKRIIVDAVERIYSRKAFDKVSMREIAAEAGIAVSSIYRYFPDQQSLFVEAFIRGTNEIIRLADDHIRNGKIQNLSDFARIYVDFLIANDHYFCMMTHFMIDGGLSGKPIERLNKAARSVLDQFERVLKNSGINIDARLYSHVLFASLNGILISFRNYPGREPEDVKRHMERLAEMAAGLLQGIGKNAAPNVDDCHCD